MGAATCFPFSVPVVCLILAGRACLGGESCLRRLAPRFLKNAFREVQSQRRLGLWGHWLAYHRGDVRNHHLCGDGPGSLRAVAFFREGICSVDVSENVRRGAKAAMVNARCIWGYLNLGIVFVQLKNASPMHKLLIGLVAFIFETN